jgi:hypothetical protein
MTNSMLKNEINNKNCCHFIRMLRHVYFCACFCKYETGVRICTLHMTKNTPHNMTNTCSKRSATEGTS